MIQFFNKLLQFIENNKIYLVIILLLISFHSFIEAIFIQLFLEKTEKIPTLLMSFDNNLITQIIFWIVVIYFLIKGIVRVCKNEKINLKTLFYTIIIGGLYLYLRHSYGTSSFTTVFSIKDFEIYYFDLILLPLTTNLILYAITKIRKQTSNIDSSKGFLVEYPITQEKDDLLNRKGVSPALVDRIYHSANSETSFAVGIVSQWGNGKTSFLNLMCEKFEKKGAILFHFKPWVYENEKSITYAFFSGLSKTLHPYNKELSHNLRLYLNILSAVDTPFTRFCSILLTQNNDFDAQHEKISNAIKAIGKPIIITIDDLDRLDEKEIAEVLKLIRNTASFPNTIYIAAYDREYIASALKKINECHSPQYLEKIFQMEFDLPDYERTAILEWMYEQLEPILRNENEEDKNRLKKTLVNTTIDNQETLDASSITNMREATRLINMFSMAYDCLKGEIDIVDLMAIELLRMKYPLAYNLLLKKRKNILVSERRGVTDEFIYTPNRVQMSIELNELFKSKIEKSIVDKMISHIFPGNIGELNKRIYSQNYCHLYFYYTLLDSDISASNFKEICSRDTKGMKKFIATFDDDKVLLMFKKAKVASEKFKDTDEYKQLLLLFFVLSENRLIYDRLKQHLINIINQYPNQKKETYREEMNQILITVMDEFPTYKLTLELMSSNGSNFDILDYFKNETAAFTKQYEYLRFCFNDNLTMEQVGELMGYSFIKKDKENKTFECKRYEKTNQLFIVYINNHLEKLDELLPLLIISDNGETFRICALNKNKIDIWGGFDKFKDFINSIDRKYETPILTEFLYFFKECEARNFNEYLRFEFKEIWKTMS